MRVGGARAPRSWRVGVATPLTFRLTFLRMRLAHGLIATRLTALPLAALVPTLLAAQAAPVAPAITFSGEVRTRSEVDRPDGPSSADASTAVRSRLAARARLHDGVRLVVGLQSNRMLDANAGPETTDALDVYEGYLEVGSTQEGVPLALRAGRHELGVGNERLIGRRNWSNTKHSFDGVRLLAGPSAPAAWSAAAFAVTPAERTRVAGASAWPTHRIFGVSAARTPAGLPGATAEAIVVHDRGARSGGREVVGRTTVSGRYRVGRLAGLGAELEGAVQTGSRRLLADTAAGRTESIGAWMVAARLGTPARAGRRLTAAVGADLLSGDASPADGRHGAFDTLHGSNHSFYGAADIAGGNPANTLRGRGLLDVLTTSTLVVSRQVSVRTDLHRFAPVQGGGLLGWEADVIVPLRLLPGTAVDVGYSVFRAGEAGAALELGRAGRTRGWGYLQISAAF